LRSPELEKRAEFLKQRQIKRDLQRGSNGSDHGSVVGEGSWMEQVIHYLDQLESFNQQEEFLMLAGTSKEAAPRRTPQAVDLRRAENDLRKNHSQVLIANDDGSVPIKGMCLDFLKERCTYGDQCRWSHEVGEPQEAQHMAGNPPDGGGGRGVEAVRTHAITGGGRGGSPKIAPLNQPGLIGWTKMPPRTMWDSEGWTCCFRGPYFLVDPEGPCLNVLTCPYSHWKPVHSVRPANATR
jgi:hypothetical protein